MSNISDAMRTLATQIEAISPVNDSATPYHRYLGLVGEDTFGEADHRTFSIVPLNGIISQDQGLSRQNLVTYLSLELKFNRQFYEEQDLYTQIMDEVHDIQSRISVLVWGGGIGNVSFEDWTLAETEETNALQITFRLKVIHDEPEA